MLNPSEQPAQTLPAVAAHRPAPRWRHLALVSAPIGISLLIHAGVIAGLTIVAWRIAHPDDNRDPHAGEVFLALTSPEERPAPAEAPRPSETPNADPEPEPNPAAQPEVAPEPQPVPPPLAKDPPPLEPDLPAVAPAPSEPATPTRQPQYIDVPTGRKPAPNRGTPGPKVPAAPPATTITFAGMKADRAASVVYVVDCSGPMVTILPRLLAEVRSSVERLDEDQRFGVVLFGDAGADPDAPPPIEALDGKLCQATAKETARLVDWLKKITPRGKSNPLDGLRAALAMEPEVVFLLSRSIPRSQGSVWGAGYKATLDELERLNPRGLLGKRRTIIKTIQFSEDDPTGTMQAIARLHGGTGDSAYRVMRRDELGR